MLGLLLMHSNRRKSHIFEIDLSDNQNVNKTCVLLIFMCIRECASDNACAHNVRLLKCVLAFFNDYRQFSHTKNSYPTIVKPNARNSSDRN